MHAAPCIMRRPREAVTAPHVGRQSPALMASRAALLGLAGDNFEEILCAAEDPSRGRPPRTPPEDASRGRRRGVRGGGGRRASLSCAREAVSCVRARASITCAVVRRHAERGRHFITAIIKGFGTPGGGGGTRFRCLSVWLFISLSHSLFLSLLLSFSPALSIIG